MSVRARVRVAVMAFLVAAVLGSLIYRSFYMPLYAEPQREIKAIVLVRRLAGDPRRIHDIRVTNDNDWTWPVARMAINDKYALEFTDWEPGKTYTLRPSYFTTAFPSRSPFNDESAIQIFRVVIKTHGFFDQVLGVWEISRPPEAQY